MTSLYSPYRAIGYVCDANPFSVNRLGEEIFITVSIGSCFQVFRLNRLVACLVSKKAPGNISGVQVCFHYFYMRICTFSNNALNFDFHRRPSDTRPLLPLEMKYWSTTEPTLSADTSMTMPSLE